MIEETIFSRLSTFAGLTALIGAPPNCRVYPHELAPENALFPYVTYSLISAPREIAMGADPGLVRSRWQFDAWGLDPDDARDVAEQLRKALERWRGAGSGTTVQDTFIDNQQNSPPVLVNSVPAYRRITDAMIHYTE